MSWYNILISDERMKNNFNKILICLVLLTAISAVPVSAQTCTDSDNGNDYYVRGNVTYCTGGMNPSCGISYDSCQKTGLLREYYCEGSSVEHIDYNCSNGCKDGTCLVECTGIVMIWPSERREVYNYSEDTCPGYRCVSGNEIGPTCYNFQNCSEECNGDCVYIPLAKKQCKTNCTDTDDGKDYYVKGSVTYRGHKYEDWCTTNQGNGGKVPSCSGDECDLVEEYCSEKTSGVDHVLYHCPNGCKDGVCIKEEKKCTDSDGGEDYYEKGQLTDENGEKHTDYCWKDNPDSPQGPEYQNMLREYSCTLNESSLDPNIEGYGGPEGTGYYEISYDCPNGCEDGACIGKENKSNLIIENISLRYSDLEPSGVPSYIYTVFVKNIGNASAGKSHLKTIIKPKQPQRINPGQPSEYYSMYGGSTVPIPMNDLVSGDVLPPEKEERYFNYFNPSEEGKVTIEAIADVYNEVAETSEDDNKLKETFYVKDIFDINISCMDTDNGNDPEQGGTVKINKTEYNDSCVRFFTGNSKLKEWYCENNEAKWKYYDCKRYCQEEYSVVGRCKESQYGQGYCNCEINRTCTDGTPLRECSESKPLYCNEDLKLINRCQKCGCSSEQKCNNQTGECEAIPIENRKNISLYSEKEAFLISDKDWRNVLPLIPVTSWTNEEIHNYPTLIYHKEDKTDEVLVGNIQPYIFLVSSKKGLGSSGIYENACSERQDKLYVTEVNIQEHSVRVGEKIHIDLTIENCNQTSQLGIRQLSVNLEEAFGDHFSSFDGSDLGTIEAGGNKKLEVKLKFLESLPKSFDVDSIIHFLQQYKPDRVTIVGNTFPEINELLIASPNLGAGLEENQLQKITPEDYIYYWQGYKDVIYVENKYELALLASTYASLINAPLIIEGTDLDVDVIFNNKNVTCVGSVNRNCDEQYNMEQLQKRYIRETETDKIILVNPNDLEIKINKEFQPEKSADPINRIYSKTSLNAPILASAKHELILLNNVSESPENPDCNKVPEITQNAEETDSFIESSVKSLFNNSPSYLTIVAQPRAIPDSVYRRCDGNVAQMRENMDFYYAMDPDKVNAQDDYMRGKSSVILDDNKNLHAVFTSIVGGTKYKKGDRRVYYKKMNADEEVSMNDTLISDIETDWRWPNPQIDIDDEGNTYILWADETENKGNLFFSKLNSSGNRLIHEKGLGIKLSSFDFSFSLTPKGKILLVASRGPNGYLYFYKLDSNGTILTEKKLKSNHTFSIDAEIDKENNFHITYTTSDKRHYIKTDDNGRILIGSMELFQKTTSRQDSASVHFGDQNQVIILSPENNETTSNIYMAKMDKEGNILIDSKKIITDTGCGFCIGRFSSLYNSKNNNIYLTWSDYRDGNWEIYFKKIDGEGNFITGEKRLTNNLRKSRSPIIAYLGDKLIVLFQDKRKATQKIYYKILKGSWSELKRFTFLQNLNFNFRMKVGRIYGLTSSDVSAYIARSIFYNDLFSNIYDLRQFTGLSIGHHWVYSDFNDVAQYIKKETSKSGYNSLCFTGEPREGCITGMRPNASYYNGRQFITFSDHGWSGGWSGTLNYNEIPWLDLSYSIGEACLTNTFWQGGKKTFGVWMLRKGAIGYHGATGTGSGAQNYATNSIRLLTGPNRITLGTIGNNDMMLFNRNFRAEMIFLGDPTLRPIFKEVIWH